MSCKIELVQFCIALGLHYLWLSPKIGCASVIANQVYLICYYVRLALSLHIGICIEIRDVHKTTGNQKFDQRQAIPCGNGAPGGIVGIRALFRFQGRGCRTHVRWNGVYRQQPGKCRIRAICLRRTCGIVVCASPKTRCRSRSRGNSGYRERLPDNFAGYSVRGLQASVRRNRTEIRTSGGNTDDRRGRDSFGGFRIGSFAVRIFFRHYQVETNSCS